MARTAAIRKQAATSGTILINEGLSGIMAAGLRAHAQAQRAHATLLATLGDANARLGLTVNDSAEQLDAIADAIDHAELTLVIS